VTTELVPFHGDFIEATKTPDGRVLASIKRCCESLGVDYSTQLLKLKRSPWATVGIIPTVAGDGKRCQQVTVDLDSLPMWMATIHSSKVADAVRPKLLAYQMEAKEVLAVYFFGDNAKFMAELRAFLDGRFDKDRRCRDRSRQRRPRLAGVA